jgi:hypothetical protein
MALISHADWLDRFGDLADDSDDFDLASLRFRVQPAEGSRPVGAPWAGASDAGHALPLLGYRAGERRAAPRLSR